MTTRVNPAVLKEWAANFYKKIGFFQAVQLAALLGSKMSTALIRQELQQLADEEMNAEATDEDDSIEVYNHIEDLPGSPTVYPVFERAWNKVYQPDRKRPLEFTFNGFRVRIERE
jgi:hypothetical protein